MVPHAWTQILYPAKRRFGLTSRSLSSSPLRVHVQVRQLEANLRAQGKVVSPTTGGGLPPGNSPGSNTIPSVRGSPPGTFNGGGGDSSSGSRFPPPPSSPGSGRGGMLSNGMPNPNGPGYQPPVSSKPSGTEWLHNDDFRGGGKRSSNSLASGGGGGLAKSNDGEASMVREYNPNTLSNLH